MSLLCTAGAHVCAAEIAFVLLDVGVLCSLSVGQKSFRLYCLASSTLFSGPRFAVNSYQNGAGLVAGVWELVRFLRTYVVVFVG